MPTNAMIVPRSITVSGQHGTSASFLQSFTSHEAQRQAAKQKPMLSIEEHAAYRAQLTDVLFI
jgi:hypothetical protein